jgi:hypothetical protein
VSKALSREELEALHCWEADDAVPGRPQMSDFRRRLRYHQAQWRETNGHPIGSQPIVPRADGKPVRLVGSRIPLAYARETGANFVTPGAFNAARTRTSITEPHQSFDHQRVWAELLWSPSLAFNLFGDLACDLALADCAVHAWWPEVPGTVCDVRFAHSPGRFDWAYLGSLRAFDAAFVLDVGDGTRGIIAVDVNYHERVKPAVAKPAGRARQREVAERSGAFVPKAVDAMDRTDLLVTSLEHLLLLSMLQHESGLWSFGRYVVVYPEGNLDFADACTRYADFLPARSTFSVATIEALLDADALPRETATALRGQYIVPSHAA